MNNFEPWPIGPFSMAQAYVFAGCCCRSDGLVHPTFFLARSSKQLALKQRDSFEKLSQPFTLFFGGEFQGGFSWWTKSRKPVDMVTWLKPKYVTNAMAMAFHHFQFWWPFNMICVMMSYEFYSRVILDWSFSDHASVSFLLATDRTCQDDRPGPCGLVLCHAPWRGKHLPNESAVNLRHCGKLPSYLMNKIWRILKWKRVALTLGIWFCFGIAHAL